MTQHAQGIAETIRWEEQPYLELEDGRRLTKAAVTQGLTGDIVGELLTEYIMAYPRNNYASYVGMALVKGTLAGKQGSFVLQLNGTFDGTLASGTWFVVPDSGTAALEGLRGEGKFQAPEGTKMEFTLDYTFA